MSLGPITRRKGPPKTNKGGVTRRTTIEIKSQVDNYGFPTGVQSCSVNKQLS